MVRATNITTNNVKLQISFAPLCIFSKTNDEAISLTVSTLHIADCQSSNTDPPPSSFDGSVIGPVRSGHHQLADSA